MDVSTDDSYAVQVAVQAIVLVSLALLLNPSETSHFGRVINSHDERPKPRAPAAAEHSSTLNYI
jgi:hypothetical protein